MYERTLRQVAAFQVISNCAPMLGRMRAQLSYVRTKSGLLISADKAHRKPNDDQPHRNGEEQGALQRPCSYPVAPSQELR